jgi:hypothetical protein
MASVNHYNHEKRHRVECRAVRIECRLVLAASLEAVLCAGFCVHRATGRCNCERSIHKVRPVQAEFRLASAGSRCAVVLIAARAYGRCGGTKDAGFEKMKKSTFILAAGFSILIAPALAQQTATQQRAASGGYFRIDGSYQSVNLPNFSLGLINVIPGTGVFGGQMQQYATRATGHGISGAVGYIVPNGTFPAGIGSNARLELGVSWIDADASQSAADLTNTGIVSVRRLNGLGIVSQNCLGCTAVSTLKTDHDSLQFNLKGASDFFSGPIRWTPSVATFAGRSVIEQRFSQNLVGAPVNQPTDYSSLTTVHWTDFGGRAGLDVKFKIADWITTGIGGTAGIARRRATLSGNDVSQVAGLGGPALSSIGAATTTSAFLATGEINLEVRPTSALIVHSFAGLRYDNKVPGISSPSYTGAIAGPPTSTTAAGLTFSAETSFYAGGGVLLKFAP